MNKRFFYVLSCILILSIFVLERDAMAQGTYESEQGEDAGPIPVEASSYEPYSRPASHESEADEGFAAVAEKLDELAKAVKEAKDELAKIKEELEIIKARVTK